MTLRDPRQAAVLLENSTYSMRIYRNGTVDHEFFDKAVVLTEDTVEALYSDFAPVPPTTPSARKHSLAGLESGRLKLCRGSRLESTEWVTHGDRSFVTRYVSTS